MIFSKPVSPRNAATCLFAYHCRAQRATLANHWERSSLQPFTGGIASLHGREFTRHSRGKLTRRENIFKNRNCGVPFPWPRPLHKWVTRSAYPWHSRDCTNPGQQGCQVRPVSLPYGPEFESDSRARNRESRAKPSGGGSHLSHSLLSEPCGSSLVNHSTEAGSVA